MQLFKVKSFGVMWALNHKCPYVKWRGVLISLSEVQKRLRDIDIWGELCVMTKADVRVMSLQVMDL